MSDVNEWRARTRAAQALGRIDAATQGLVPPLHVTTTFIRDPAYADWSGPIYGRPDNQTVREAEALIGSLEGAAATLVFGSGMSAAIALFLSLGPGARVVAPRRMYWALRHWLKDEAANFGLEVAFCDPEDLAALAAAVAAKPTRLVWLETPSNPLWSVTDIAAAATIAHAAGAALAVDSTCATPIFTRPLELGADVVMHSATKYLNGHSDAIAGALGLRARRRAGGAGRRNPQAARPDPRAVRGVPADPRLAHARSARARRGGQRVRIGAAPVQSRRRRRSALSRPARPSRPRDRQATDGGRFRRHAVDPRARRPRRRDRRRGAGEAYGSAPRRSAASNR